MKNKNKIKCFNCGKEFEFSEEHIPDGLRYEIVCPHCRSRVWRKKIGKK